jgi:hypothetical protein
MVGFYHRASWAQAARLKDVSDQLFTRIEEALQTAKQRNKNRALLLQRSNARQ